MGGFANHLLLLLILLMIRSSTCDFAAERAECTDKLIGLSECLSYAQASGGGSSATEPPPGCCSGFKEVVSKSLKCVCILIKDRNEPGLGFKVDVQRALSLPPKCHTSTNISDCPRLLNLSSNSPQAKEFLQFANELKNATTPTSASINVKGNTVSTPSNDGWKRNGFGFGVEMSLGKWICFIVVLLYFNFNVI